MPIRIISFRVWGTVLLVLLAGSGGCEAPKGDSGGRVETHKTTKAEKSSYGMNIGDMASAADDISQALAADINRLSKEEFGEYRVWLVYGDIANKTRTMPHSDFEMIRERMKDRLQKSGLFRANIKFVARSSEVTALNEQEFGQPDDPLQEGGNGGGVERPEKKHMYYLRGSAFAVLRGSTEFYYLSFNLTRASDGTEVFSQEYEMKYSKKRH